MAGIAEAYKPEQTAGPQSGDRRQSAAAQTARHRIERHDRGRVARRRQARAGGLPGRRPGRRAAEVISPMSLDRLPLSPRQRRIRCRSRRSDPARAATPASSTWWRSAPATVRPISKPASVWPIATPRSTPPWAFIRTMPRKPTPDDLQRLDDLLRIRKWSRCRRNRPRLSLRFLAARNAESGLHRTDAHRGRRRENPSSSTPAKPGTTHSR